MFLIEGSIDRARQLAFGNPSCTVYKLTSTLHDSFQCTVYIRAVARFSTVEWQWEGGNQKILNLEKIYGNIRFKFLIIVNKYLRTFEKNLPKIFKIFNKNSRIFKIFKKLFTIIFRNIMKKFII